MIVNLVNQKFGRLTVIRQAGTKIQKCLTWECKCSCGALVLVKGKDLKSGKIHGCKKCSKKDILIDFSKYSQYGIYGIYVEDNLYYVGMTMRAFNERFKEHKEFINNPEKKNPQQFYLYKQIRQDILNHKNYEFRILEDCGLKQLNKHEVELLEKLTIRLLNPKFNYIR